MWQTKPEIFLLQLYWSKRLKSSMSLQEYRQVLPGDRLSFQVADLDPDSTYFVQVSWTDTCSNHSKNFYMLEELEKPNIWSAGNK